MKFFKKKQNLLAIGGLIIIIAVSGVISAQAKASANEGVVIIEHIKGNPDGEITLTKYSDLQCPSCRAAYPVVDQILEDYGDVVRFEYKHMPLPSIHPHAIRAGQALEVAGQQGEFFSYHDLVFDNQQQWSRSHNPDALLISYAETLDLDMKLFRRHLNSSILEDKVVSEMNEGFEKGYNSTPTFEINGEEIDYRGYDNLKNMIENLLSEE